MPPKLNSVELCAPLRSFQFAIAFAFSFELDLAYFSISRLIVLTSQVWPADRRVEFRARSWPHDDSWLTDAEIRLR